MPTPKHSLLAKTIIWYLIGTNSQATSLQVGYVPFLQECDCFVTAVAMSYHCIQEVAWSCKFHSGRL